MRRTPADPPHRSTSPAQAVPGRAGRAGVECLARLKKTVCVLPAGLALALAAAPVMAIDWSFKAFGTLAAIGTDSGNIGFRRDYTQDDGATSNWRADIDSRLGLQLDANFNQEWHAGVQWVARNHAGNFFEQNLDWAYLRWRPFDDLDVRLGRLGFDAFLLSDYRNVGYAYPWMRPPSEFYAPLFTYHFDGADIAKRFDVGGGWLTLKGYAGHTLDDTLAPQSGATVATLEMAMAGGNLVYESGNWRARIGYTFLTPLREMPLRSLHAALENPQTQAAWPVAQSVFDTLSIVGKQLHFGAIGLAYDDGTWPIQAEAAYIGSNIAWLPDIATAYLSVGRRFGGVTVYALSGIGQSPAYHVAVPQPSVSTPTLADLAGRVDHVLNSNGVDQVSASLGARWDVYENVALKAQWSHFWLGQNGMLYWLELKPPLPDQVNVWSFGVDFVY